MFFFTPLIWELNFEPKASFILRMLCTTELNPQTSAKWLWLHKISIHIVIATLYIFAFSLFFENSTENMVNFDHTPPTQVFHPSPARLLSNCILFQNRRKIRRGVNHCLLDMKWPPHSRTHRSYICLFKIKPGNIPTWMGSSFFWSRFYAKKVFVTWRAQIYTFICFIILSA